MRQLLFILFAGAMILGSCKQKEKSTGKEVKEETTVDRTKDSTEIRNTVTDFYTWYNKNYPKFNAFDLYSSIKKKDEPPYKLNWEVVDKYQAFIRYSVPQLGDEFLKNQLLLFKKCDSAFKVDVNDDIPYYFDFDWYTNSQEDPQYLVDELNDESSNWVIGLKGDAATVNVSVTRVMDSKPNRESIITLAMKKENGKWKIAKIADN